jgi:pilus assembly protein Flp/PilA
MTAWKVALADVAERFTRNDRGATSIEYGLIAVLVVVGMLIGLSALGAGNKSSWGNTSSKITNAMQGQDN